MVLIGLNLNFNHSFIESLLAMFLVDFTEDSTHNMHAGWEWYSYSRLGLSSLQAFCIFLTCLDQGVSFLTPCLDTTCLQI